MIAAIIGPIATLIDDCVKRAFPDKTEAEKVNAQIQMALLQADLGTVQGQIQTNMEEAKSSSIFVAGWRPFVGWACGAALAWQFLGQPFFAFFIGCFAWKLPPLPAIDSSGLNTILMGMLGLGGMRTFEKLKGVAGK